MTGRSLKDCTAGRIQSRSFRHVEVNNGQVSSRAVDDPIASLPLAPSRLKASRSSLSPPFAGCRSSSTTRMRWNSGGIVHVPSQETLVFTLIIPTNPTLSIAITPGPLKPAVVAKSYAFLTCSVRWCWKRMQSTKIYCAPAQIIGVSTARRPNMAGSKLLSRLYFRHVSLGLGSLVALVRHAGPFHLDHLACKSMTMRSPIMPATAGRPVAGRAPDLVHVLMDTSSAALVNRSSWRSSS